MEHVNPVDDIDDLRAVLQGTHAAPAFERVVAEVDRLRKHHRDCAYCDPTIAQALKGKSDDGEDLSYWEMA
jgi:hypothetical protein